MIRYVICEIHGETKSTCKKGVCDKCYRRQKYLEYKCRKFKNMKNCIYHGLLNFGKIDKCPICEELKDLL